MKHKPNILITGPIVPPFGGISIHIKRLCGILDNDFNVKLVDESSTRKENIYNLRSLNPIPYLKLLKWSDIVFIHSGNRLFKKIHIILSTLFGKKTIITLHGYGKKRNMIFRFWDQLIFSMANKIILVNEEIHDKLNLPKHKCEVRHAFLPPDMKEESPLPQLLQDKIEDAKKKEEAIIVANASRLDTFLGEDLYGLDMTVDAVKRLKEKKYKFHCIFTVSDTDQGKTRFDKAMEDIEKYKLHDVLTLYAGIVSFPRLIDSSDIVIRPTNTDGDSISIREALFFNKVVIASDVVNRPEGTVLFKTRETEDLTEKLENAISGKGKRSASESIENGIPAIPEKSYTDLIMNIIEN